MIEDITTDKKQMRHELIKTRHGLIAEQRALQSLQLGSQIAAYLDARRLPDDLTVAVYCALPDEIDPAPAVALFYSMGAKVTFPCVFEKGDMEFYPLTAKDIDENPPVFLSAPNRFIKREEVADLSPVDPKDIDLMIVPGVGFDRQRNRMGYGAGCYDHYLPRTSDDIVCIGVCFDCQLVDALPVEVTDRRMDVIITPTIAF